MNLSMSLGTPQGLAMLNASNLLVVWNEFPSAEDPRCVNSTKMGILEQRWQQPSKHLFSPSFVSGLNERIPPIFYVASWEEEERGQKDPWQPSGERDSRRCWGGHGSPQRSTLWVYRASGENRGWKERKRKVSNTAGLGNCQVWWHKYYGWKFIWHELKLNCFFYCTGGVWSGGDSMTGVCDHLVRWYRIP